ncbi:MAG: Sensor histidine kinase RcsC [Anaerolineae bacterium]|nr:Sensor histidine kinase RcsC [Anaerolineae bacterium]
MSFNMDLQNHILVVDDEASVCRVLKRILDAEGYHVVTATSGEEAQTLLQQQPIDLVVSDLVMPEFSGLDLLTWAKSNFPEIEFILVTGYGTIESAVEALRLGAHDYLTKPINNAELAHSVHRALDYQRSRAEHQKLIVTLQESNKNLTKMLEASNRLAHLSPLPHLVLNEIPEIAHRQLNLKVAISAFMPSDTELETVAPDSFVEHWWGQQLVHHQLTEAILRSLLAAGKRISQSFLFDPLKQPFPFPFDTLPDPPDSLTPLLAIPLDTRGGKLAGILWIIDLELPVSIETILRLEIFANQIVGALENSRLFSQQINQLRARNTLVSAGQRIATMLDRTEVVNTVLEATLRVIPHVELAALYFRTNVENDLEVVTLTAKNERLTTSPIDQGLIAQALVDRLPIYQPAWQPQADQPVRSLMIEPLAVSAVPMGALALIGQKANAFNEDLHQILTMLANQAAIALQNALLYAEAQRVDEIEALYEAGRAIDRTLNLQETLTTTMAVSRSLTGASVSNVYLYAGENQRIDSVVTLSDAVELTDADRRRAAAIAQNVAASQQAGLIIEPQPPQNGAPPQTIKSWLAIPLPSGSTVMGVLQLGSEHPNTFSANDVRLMQIVSSHAAAAIEKARLYEEVQHQLQQTEALNTISQSISTTLHLDRVLELVVQSAAKTITVATHSELYLLNPNSQSDALESRASAPGHPLPVELEPIQQHVVQLAMRTKDTVRMTHQTREHGTWSLLVAPLRVGEAVIGAISVKSPRPDAFHPSDETLLNTFASHASIAIQNANLFRDLSSAYTDLSTKQEEILRSHSTLKALFNGITDGLYIIDPNLNIVTINQAEAQRLGTTPETLTGRPCNEALWGEAAPALTRIVQDTFATGKEGIWETKADIDNRNLFADRNVHTYPIFSSSGAVNQVIILAQDMSEQLRLQASLFRSANMAAVGQLASSVAHQINNPLTIIIANSQIMGMEMSEDSPDFGMIKHIEEAGTHIRKIVQNLLDFSTQDSYDWFETDLEETIDDALTLVSHSLRKSDISVTKQIDPMPTIIASASHLKLLWMNLLLNARDAIDATEARGGAIEIIAGQANNYDVQIRLIDNGIGIPVQHRDRLFHPFFTTKSSGKNLGLGLFTCGAIVETHQGKIEIDNNLNAPGAVVTVTLPIEGSA